MASVQIAASNILTRFIETHEIMNNMKGMGWYDEILNGMWTFVPFPDQLQEVPSFE